MPAHPTARFVNARLAAELDVAEAQVAATVPFIARYRKEVTGGLDDGQLRTLEVDVDRQRIGLTLRLTDQPRAHARALRLARSESRRKSHRGNDSDRARQDRGQGSMAEALRDAGFGR